MKQIILYLLLACVVLALLSLDRESRQCLDCGIQSEHKVFRFAGLELFETSAYERNAVSRFLDPGQKCPHDRKRVTLGRGYYALFLDPGMDYAYLRHMLFSAQSDDAAFYDFLELSQAQSPDFRELVRFAVSDRWLDFPVGSEERNLAGNLPDCIRNEFDIYKEDPAHYRNPFTAEAGDAAGDAAEAGDAAGAGDAAAPQSRQDFSDVIRFFRSGMSAETASPAASPEQM